MHNDKVSAREKVLNMVAECVCHDRNIAYGEPEDNFRLIAALWTEYLMAKGLINAPLASEDVAMLMCLLKIARIATSVPKLDSYVDLAGYAVCGGAIINAKPQSAAE